MANESNFYSDEMEASCSRHQPNTMIQTTPEKAKVVNKRLPSPLSNSPNKRIKSGKQLLPIGIVTITSPNKNPQKNYFSPQKKDFSPQKKEFSPQKKNFSPQKKNFSPQKKDFSPQKNFSPQKKNFSPQKKKFSPQKNTLTNYFLSPSKSCISPKPKAEMDEIESQNTPKVVKDLASDMFPEDDDIEKCDMPGTPERLNRVQFGMNKWREKTSQSSDLAEFDANEDNSSLSSPSMLVADLACVAFPVKDECDMSDLHNSPQKLHGLRSQMSPFKWSHSTPLSKLCISPTSKREMRVIDSQNCPKVVEDLACLMFPEDDDIEKCEMPCSPEKFPQTKMSMNNWREKMSQSSDSTEFEGNDDDSCPLSPSLLAADFECGGFAAKDDLCEMQKTPEKLHGQRSQMLKWSHLPSTSKSEMCRIKPQCTLEKGPGVEFPSDDDLERCDMPDTPEKLKIMQDEMGKWMMGNKNAGSDSTELDEDEKKVWDDMDDYCEIIDSPPDLWNDEESTPIEFPDHIMENIFCRLPIRKLCKDANRVCKRWNEIISNAHFIPWKKCYFRLKFEDKTVNEEIAKICLDQNMAHTTLCFVGVMRYMKGFFNIGKSDSMLPAIRKHSKYSWAISLLTERVADCVEDEVPFMGSVIAALCILCSDVREIVEILNCLTHHKSKCSVVDALECLYCLATLFYYFKRNFSVNPGLHYRVYYALFHFESGSNSIGIQNNKVDKHGVKEDTTVFTHEQFQIINHPLGPNQIVKILAFAGTGKTTTLVAFTKKWPGKKFLNVCFNKSVQMNAKKIFPENVKSVTAHSLAWVIGQAYCTKEKLAFKLFPNTFTEFLDGEDKLVRAAIALKTIENFVYSSDELITTLHVPNGRKIKDNFVNFTMEEKIFFRDDAILLWKLMIDLNQPVKMSHDVYVKLYQLSSPTIPGYDCMLIDEGQDLNAAMTDFLFRQSYSKIIVGDSNQQVYSFRGAVNILNTIQATHVYYLTQSFRFGPEIAYLASCTLETFKQEHRNTIVGTLKEGKISGETKGQIAILARTKVSLFKRAAKFCDENSVLRGAFLGKLDSYNYGIIVDIYDLYQRSRGNFVYINNRFINRFKTFNLLRDFAESTNDIDLMGSIMIVECYPTSIPQIMEKLRKRCNHQLENADVIFSTTHKAKGHEFDTVILTDDYVRERIQNKDGVMKCNEENDDESNILYVALTRAKHRLVISNPVVEMLLAAGERFEHFISTRDIESKKCFKCQVSLIDTMKGNFTLERERIVLSSDLSINGGCLCFNCAINPNLYIPEFAVMWTQNPTAIDKVHYSLRQLVGPSNV